MNVRTVGINLLWLRPNEVGGSEQSTLATVGALAELAPSDLELRLFVLPALVQAHPGITGSLPTEVAPTDGRSRPRRTLAESTWLARRSKPLDLVHHAGGTVPLRRTAPAVLTLHDLQPLEAKATHSATKRAYLARAVPAAVKASRRVAVPSEFVRRTVLDRFGTPPEKVVVIPHAVPVRPAPTAADELALRYDLAGPVILYPAITYPHKEHATLLSAFERVARAHRDAVLVLSGGAGSCEAEVDQQIAASDVLRDRVRRIHRVPEGDIAGLLTLAAVVAVPSRYEGFGLPALEGMAAGAAVVAADATSLPEVVGDAGRLVGPGDVTAWAEAIDDLLGDERERARLGAAGRARAGSFTSAANAEAFAGLYRGALDAR
jgi:alpha-1,3-rhamnosyl/mannosyltransferase